MIFSLRRSLLTLCAVTATLPVFAAGPPGAADPPIIKSPSPNGRYALRIDPPATGDERTGKAAIIEKATGNVVLDLGDTCLGRLDETLLVWSADSRWVAYGSREPKEGATSVYVRKGSDFEDVPLPETLPEPKIRFRREDQGGAKNYGGATKPRRWLKPGELEMSNELTMVAHATGRTDTAVVNFTISIDAQRTVRVRNVRSSVITAD